MTEPTVPQKLRACQTLVTSLRDLLTQAHDQARRQLYAYNWIEAIDKCLADNDRAWLHINNVATLIDLGVPHHKRQESLAMTTLQQYIAQANTRANKNRQGLHSALILAQHNTPDPQLASAIDLATTANTVLIIMLDTILEYLKRSPPPTQP